MGTIDDGRGFIANYLSPVNTLIFFTTGVLIPLLDFLRPKTSLISYLAAVAVLFFVVLVVLKKMGKPTPQAIPSALLVTTGICACLVTVSAYASNQHPEGYAASKFPEVRSVQTSLLGLERQTAAINEKLDRQGVVLEDIRSGRSDDPRVALKNMGVAWSFAEFRDASARGDLKVMDLFLQGGMTTTLPNTTATLPAVAVEMSYPKITEQLALFTKYGFNLKAPTNLDRYDYQPPNLYALAVEKRNKEAAEYLKAQGVSVAEYESWKIKRKNAEEKAKKGPYLF